MNNSATTINSDNTLPGADSSVQKVPEYCRYWGLHKPAFDNVPDPSMYVDAHESVENAIAETVFAIDEGNECIAVIVGDIGLGKTLSLRMILDSLNQEKYRIAFITNPDMSFVQLLKEIIGQLTGAQCEIRGRVELLEIFNRILFKTHDEHKKVLIFIDEANALTPTNLESLRLLTNMQDDTKNLFTIVLAGQMELAKRLEHPRRANLYQRIGTYNRIEKIPNIELLRHYVEARLKLAGASRAIFSENAFEMLWEYSEHGVPRLINKICKLSLKAGETNGLTEITDKIVEQIGQRFQKLTGPILQKRKPRKRSSQTEEKYQDDITDTPTEIVSFSPEETKIFEDLPTENDYDIEEEIEEMNYPAASQGVTEAADRSEEAGAIKETSDDMLSDNQKAGGILPTEEDAGKFSDLTEEICIKDIRFKAFIPHNLFEEAQIKTQAERDKMAGVLAAKTMEDHKDHFSTSTVDPVFLWCELKDYFLQRLIHAKEA
ncbi:MAG: AAA family ATPase [Proteobacteria bacterium]|nr:AAA family ATPase [Pseudomonadota bacterium]